MKLYKKFTPTTVLGKRNNYKAVLDSRFTVGSFSKLLVNKATLNINWGSLDRPETLVDCIMFGDRNTKNFL